MCSTLAILPLCAVAFSLFSFLLQLIVLPSDEWGHFSSRRIRGILEEKGNFGLWRLCSVKTPVSKGGIPKEVCVHPEDSPYEFPTYATAAGAVSIIHLLVIGSFLALAIIRVLQIVKSTPDLYLGTKRLCVVKVSIALICVILSITVSILASVGEGRVRQFDVYKGWAFWVQILIISVDIVILLICAFENIQYWQARMMEPPPRDPTDEFPETFVAPDYDLPPELREDRIVYVKDASVQSQLDGENGKYLSVPGTIYGGKRDTEIKTRYIDGESDVRFDNSGATVITIGRNSPHPRKKSLHMNSN